jgi:outer membrane protein assembly factor BamE
MRILLLSLTILLLSACGYIGFPGVYKINVEQGNIVTQEMADQLKPGMNRRQVKFILGTPLIEDTFNQNRWDYLYVKRNGREVLSQSRLTVEFDGDVLANVTGDLIPANWNAAASVAPESETKRPPGPSWKNPKPKAPPPQEPSESAVPQELPVPEPGIPAP